MPVFFYLLSRIMKKPRMIKGEKQFYQMQWMLFRRAKIYSRTKEIPYLRICKQFVFILFLSLRLSNDMISGYQSLCIRKGTNGLIGNEVKPDITKDDDDSKTIKIKQVYTIRDVIKQSYRALIEDEIPFKPTDKDYISSYQCAVTTVINNMSSV